MQKEYRQYIDIEIVKQLMEQKDLSNKKLAEKMGVSTATVKRLLCGANQRHMSSRILFKISQALNTSTSELLCQKYRTKM